MVSQNAGFPGITHIWGGNLALVSDTEHYSARASLLSALLCLVYKRTKEEHTLNSSLNTLIKCDMCILYSE